MSFKVNDKVLVSMIYPKVKSKIIRETPTLWVLSNGMKFYKNNLSQVGDKYTKIIPINKRNIKQFKKNQYKRN